MREVAFCGAKVMALRLDITTNQLLRVQQCSRAQSFAAGVLKAGDVLGRPHLHENQSSAADF